MKGCVAMDILFKNGKIEKICNNNKLAQKKYGYDTARKLIMRLDALKASECLNDISHLPPPRLHSINKIKGERVYGIVLAQGYRMVIEVENLKEFLDDDKKVDKRKVTRIVVCSVEDYHG
jgi:proteic killer suppression protein